jgi:hypothetical protein
LLKKKLLICLLPKTRIPETGKQSFGNRKPENVFLTFKRIFIIKAVGYAVTGEKRMKGLVPG